MTAPIITERAVLGMFYESLMQSTGTAWVDAISTPAIRSDQDSETYPWLGMVPQLRERRGPKQFDQLRTTTWAVANVPYQGGVSIPKHFILYDKTDQVRMRIDDVATRAKAHWASLVAPLVLNGASSVCYDGQYFFDTDHAEGDSGAQSNSIAADISTYPVSVHGSTTEPSAGEMVHAIMAGIQQMIAFKDDKGEFCNEGQTEFLVLTGHTLMKNSVAALRARAIDGGDTNILVEQDSFRFRVEATPRLGAWTNKFAIFALGGNQKPIIRQQRVPNNPGTGYDVDGMLFWTLWLESEHCKKKDEVLVSVETERAAAYGDWKKACLVTLT
ncbi:Mu-like prophage major head subunit gpT family protein [Azospirillum sp. ST 5-10]|uniref:Mu-like prophage major head subunit gpT family protein n=1 Tax=unclassified Azospirillum TaxID=2630922 RepID=UPI003F49FA1B